MIYKTNSGYGVNFNQIVENGDFVDSTKWSGKNATISVSNGVCTFTANAQWGGLRHSLMPITAGHRYIIKCDLKATTAGSNMFINLEGSVNLSLSDGYIPLTTDWQTYTYRSVAFSAGGDFYLVFGDRRSADRDAFQVKNVYLTDMTQDFGAGYEPTTVAEFREMYPDDYYDYTLSQWQWSKKGKITSYPTPVIENGTTLLPIENHIVGLAKNGIGRIEIEGNSYQNGTPTPTSPIPIQSFNGSGDTVKLVGAGGKELQLPNSIILNNQTISLELNKVGTYADKLIIDKASGKVELVKNFKEIDLGSLSWYKPASQDAMNIDGRTYAAVSDSLSWWVTPDALSNKLKGTAYGNINASGLMNPAYHNSFGIANGFIQISYPNGINYDMTTAQIKQAVTGITVLYRISASTTTDITDATYQINGITYNVSDWLNFVDREIEIETDGLAQSNLSVDYEPTLIYNYAKRELPVGFVRLDYIESTGTQYIDTGVAVNTIGKIRIRYKNTYPSLSSISALFGGRYTDNDTSLQCRVVNGNTGYSWANNRFNLSADSDIKDVEITSTYLKINGTIIAQYTSNAITDTDSLILFGRRQDNSGSAVQNLGYFGCFDCEIYDTNLVIIRKYLSVYRFSDGIEGLYDTVGKQFYTNQGTGRFIRGNIIDGGILNNGN